MNQIVRRLTKSSQQKLKNDIVSGSINNQTKTIEVADYQSEVLDDRLEINFNQHFVNKFELGQYLYQVFKDSSFKPDESVWNWLGLNYFDRLLNTKGQIGQIQRLFIFQNEYQGRFTHLLMGPYEFYCHYCQLNLIESVKFFLQDDINVNGGIYLETIKRFDLARNIKFIETIKTLFFDGSERRISGSQEKLIRLIKVWQQYDRSFDLYHISSEDFINLLRKTPRHQQYFSSFLNPLK